MIAGHLPELAILLVVVLIFFGPKRLPEMGGALGQGIRDFRKGLSHVEAETGLNPHTDPTAALSAPTHVDGMGTGAEHAAPVAVPVVSGY